MIFPEDNAIVFFQDMNWYEGVPSGIDFDVEIKKDGTVYLTASNYGKTGDYGNGILILKFGSFESLLRDIKKEIGDLAYDAIVADVKSKMLKVIKHS